MSKLSGVDMSVKPSVMKEEKPRHPRQKSGKGQRERAEFKHMARQSAFKSLMKTGHLYSRK